MSQKLFHDVHEIALLFQTQSSPIAPGPKAGAYGQRDHHPPSCAVNPSPPLFP